MNIIIITQDDPFYLGRNLDFLLQKLPAFATVRLCILTRVSPFGKSKSTMEKILDTVSIFGMRFFFRYSVKYLIQKLNKKHRVTAVLHRHSIPVLEIDTNINNKKVLSRIREISPDLMISIASNQIFKRQLIQSAKFGIINLHTSDLPKYRGLFPTFWALKNGESRLGISVFFIDRGIDSGPILIKKHINISERNLEKLNIESKRMGMKCIL